MYTTDTDIGIDRPQRASQAAGIESAHRGVSWARAWQGLRNPNSTNEFYGSWLTLLCGGIAGAKAALLLIRSDDGAFVPAGIWPDASVDPTYLSPTAQRALVNRAAVVEPAVEGQP